MKMASQQSQEGMEKSPVPRDRELGWMESRLRELGNSMGTFKAGWGCIIRNFVI